MEELFDVSGRAVIVTGGASGLGAAFAELLAARGARLLIADFNAPAAEDVAAGLPGEGHDACLLDVRDEASCEAVVARAQEVLGGVDVIINSAGVFRGAPALELSLQDFEDSLAANVTGTFLMARHGARAMMATGGGRIINMASVSSRVVNANYAAYSTSKAAVAQLTRLLAIEWAPHNVTVNAIGPAVIPTPMSEPFLADSKFHDYAIGKIPMGRFGEPSDLFGALLLLASPAGSFITGQILYVDGGRTLL